MARRNRAYEIDIDTEARLTDRSYLVVMST